MVDFFAISALAELPFLLIAMSMSAKLLAGFSDSLKAYNNGFTGGQIGGGQLGGGVTGGGGSINTGGGGYTGPGLSSYFASLSSYQATRSRSSSANLFSNSGSLFSSSDPFAFTSSLFDPFESEALGSSDLFGDFTSSIDFGGLLSSFDLSDFLSKRDHARTVDPAALVRRTEVPTPIAKRQAAPTAAPNPAKRLEALHQTAQLEKRASVARSLSQVKSRISAMVALYTLLFVAFVARIVMIPTYIILHHKRKAEEGSSTTANMYTDEFGVSRPLDSSANGATAAAPTSSAATGRYVHLIRSFFIATVSILAILFILGIVTFAVQGSFFGVVGPYSGVEVAFWVLSIVIGAATCALLWLHLRKVRGGHLETSGSSYEYGGTTKEAIGAEHSTAVHPAVAPGTAQPYEQTQSPVYENGSAAAHQSAVPASTTEHQSHIEHSQPQTYIEQHQQPEQASPPASQSAPRPLPLTPEHQSHEFPQQAQSMPAPQAPLPPSVGSGMQPGTMYVAVADGHGGTMMVPVSQQQQQQFQQNV